MRTKSGMVSMDALDAMVEQARDNHPTVTHCCHCKRFRHRGTAAEGREAFAEHLRSKHPDVSRRKRVRLVRGIRKSARLDKAEKRKREQEAA